MRPNTIRRRAAFTLVELMVAMAVIILIMAILSRAFVVSADTFRQLKAVGDMTDQLRAAQIVIRRDLRADHFLPEDGKPNKGLKVSDQRLDRLTIAGVRLAGPWTPPTGGFFRAKCGPPDGANVIDEGTDNDLLRSYRATNHYLHFTSTLPGGRDGDVYTATVAGNSLTSEAAEIALFLDPTPSGNTGGTNTYNLIRRQRLVGMYDPGALQPDPAVVSVNSSGAVNTMADLTNPNQRLGRALAAVPTAGANDNGLSPSTRTGDDILLSNVLSMEVKLLWTPAVAAGGYNRKSFGTTSTLASGNEDTDGPFNFIPNPNTPTISGLAHNPQVLNTFDTWTTQFANWNAVGVNRPGPPDALPQRVRVQAVRIVIRVWDTKLKLSRQMTIVQEL